MKGGEIGEVRLFASDFRQDRLRYEELEEFDSDAGGDADGQQGTPTAIARESCAFPSHAAYAHGKPTQQQKKGSFAEWDQMTDVGDENCGDDGEFENSEPFALGPTGARGGGAVGGCG
jgi:hypothetical protein